MQADLEDQRRQQMKVHQHRCSQRWPGVRQNRPDVSLQNGNQCSVMRNLRDNKLHPCKLQMLQHLSENDPDRVELLSGH
ncbi:hypothetical protein AVEN_138701-1 [Araneus ventricosus]|uniref:Uncharacterized protein n=2 Tax=Araneus ventricosus TaxID=182803 RepID=A0A4Y1ZN10_ARAVE|nr:hypothetical protein AVEN_138701-1 [Araneus ventricosus]